MCLRHKRAAIIGCPFVRSQAGIRLLCLETEGFAGGETTLAVIRYDLPVIGCVGRKASDCRAYQVDSRGVRRSRRNRRNRRTRRTRVASATAASRKDGSDEQE